MLDTTQRNQWFGEVRALFDAAPARDGVAWREVLLPLAERALDACRDEEAFCSVFLPTLLHLAGRWPDRLRVSPAGWRADDPRGALCRVYVVDPDSPHHLHDTLHHTPAITHLTLARHRVWWDEWAALPARHGLDTLVIELGSATPPTLDLHGLEWLRAVTFVDDARYDLPALYADAARTLCLVGCLGDRIVDALGRLTSAAPRLVSFALEGCSPTPEQLDDALHMAALRRAESLRLTRCGLTDAHALILAQAPLVALRELSVEVGALTSVGARVLASAPWLGGLTRLTLVDHHIGPEGLRALRAALDPACQLVVEGCWGAQPLDAIALRDEPPPRVLLEALRVAHEHAAHTLTLRKISGEQLHEVISRAPASITSLHFVTPYFDDDALRMLAECPLVERLRALSITLGAGGHPRLYNRAWIDALRALLARTTRLERLDLTGSNGARAVCGALPPALHTLSLRGTALTDDHAAELSNAIRTQGALRVLDVSQNEEIGPASLERLASVLGLEVEAAGCWGESMLRAAPLVLEAPDEERRKTLRLCAARMVWLESLTLERAAWTATQLERVRPPNLRRLALRDCALTDEHLRSLPAGLDELELREEALDDAMGEALGEATLAQLTSLTLARTRLSAQALARLLDATPRLRTLTLEAHAAPLEPITAMISARGAPISLTLRGCDVAL